MSTILALVVVGVLLFGMGTVCFVSISYIGFNGIADYMLAVNLFLVFCLFTTLAVIISMLEDW